MHRIIGLVVAFVVCASIAGVWVAGAVTAAQDGTPAAASGTPCPAGAAMGTPDASPAAMPSPTVAASPAASPAAGTDACAVEIKDFAFNPATVEIPVGTTITWTNADSVAHTATALDGAFNSENLNQGQSFSHTFDAAGSHDYVCVYHANMKGTIVVE